MIKSDDGVELSTICRQLKMSAPDGKTGAVRGIKQKREPSPFSFGVELSTICRQLKMSAPDGKTGAVRGIKQKREPSPFSFQPETKKTTDQKPAYYEGDDPVKIFRRKYPVLFSTSPSNTRPTIYLIELELLAGRTKEIIGKSLVAVWKIAGGKKYCARLTTKTQKPGGGKQVKKFLSLKEELFLLQHRTELISE